VNKRQYESILKDCFAFTLVEAFEVLPKVVYNPRKASREMNRLKRHSEYNLSETIQIAEEVVE